MAESIKKFIIKDAHGGTKESGSLSVVGEVHVDIVPGYGEPYAESEYVNGVLTITIHNIEGNGITEITTDSQEGDEAVNTVTIKTNANSEGVTLEVRNGSRGNGIASSSEVLSPDDGGVNTHTFVDTDGGEHVFHTKNGRKGDKGDQGDSAVYDQSSPDAPDFVMANTTGQSTTKSMTQKAVTDELVSLNSEVESIKYRSETLFENGSSANWVKGNISSGKIVTNYDNKYFLWNKPSDIIEVSIIRGETTFTLSIYASSNGTNFSSLGDAYQDTPKVINVENYTHLLFLMWDKPTVSDAQAVPITMTGIHVVVPVEKKEIVKKLTDGGDEKVQNAESIKVLSENTYFETLTAENGYRWCQGGIQGADGTEVTNAKGIRSSWIPVEKDDEVIIKRDGLSAYNLQVVTYDANKNFVISNVRAMTDLLPTDKGFIRVAFWGTGPGAPAIKPSDAPADVVVILKPKAKEQVKYYHNPIIRADYPDPTVWYGEDGYYYLYATGMVASKTMLRSANLIDWNDTGEIPLTANAISALASAGITESFWAPCVKKMGNGKWNMYISKPSTGGVAILTSDYPSFGYEFVRFTTAPFNEYIDPDVAVERDNTVWMFAGSAYKMFRRQMTSDGLDFAEGSEWVHVAGRTKNESGNTNRVKTFEGGYLYRREGYWYLFCSSGHYANNNYAVRVVRSQTLDGEFVDKEGNAATDGYAEYVIQSNTCLYGPGHNAQIFVDKENRTWMLYHAHWEGFSSTSTRGVCIDEILWDEDGWPYVEGGTPSLCKVAPKM